MKMVEIGTNMKGDPVYNVVKDDGTLFKTTIYTKDEAQSLISGNVMDDDIIDVTVTEQPNYKDMTKLELEAMMRTHGVELDRRESKKELLKQVEEFFKET